MNELKAQACGRWIIVAALRRTRAQLATYAAQIVGLLEAAAGELRRLNAIGIETARDRARSERAAMTRKALAEGFQGRSRCC